jgi:putative ABC transport system permease protein
MFRIVLQKMIHNGWMVLCLAAGSFLAVALISSIPMYTEAIMQRMLVRDLESFQRERNTYPGTLQARYNFYNPSLDPTRARFFDYINDTTRDDLIPSLDLPVLEQSVHGMLDYMLAFDAEKPDEKNRRPNTQVQALQGLEDHITILYGREPVKGLVDGAYEVIVTEQAMLNLDLLLGNTYIIYNMMNEEEIFRLKVVGVFTQESTQDLFWFRGLREFSDSFIIDFDTFNEKFIREYTPNLSYIFWFFALDYQEIKVDKLTALLQTIDRYQRLTHEYRIDFRFPVLPMFESYNARANTLSLMLLFLQTPVLLMLVFFIYMVSQLVINNERNEIAVLKSRGAGLSQVFNIYLVESVILGGAALVVGPLFGFFIVSFLGSSNGFMEFVQRVALPVRLSPRAYLYAVGGFLLFVVTMLLPVVAFSRSSIVEHKRNKVRSNKPAFWKRFFIDIILIGMSAYGLYSYNSQQEILSITGVEGSSLPVDPLLFGISVLFILGAGLLVLRLFPFFVNFLFSIGKRVWKPHTYAAFIQVGRSGGIQQFLMIFIILSLSIGVFNSTAARTINTNVEEKIRYGTGADIALTPFWEDLNASGGGDDVSSLTEAPGAGASTSSAASPQYREPNFDPYLKLEGVEVATKVYRNERITIRAPGGKNGVAELMAVIPHEFARVAWFRRDLMPHHFFNYLNLLAASPKAMLVSSSLRDEYGLKQGDSILLSWAGQGTIEGIIYAFIDYWPAVNPTKGTSRYGHPFIVANLSLVHAKMAMEPYQIWLAKSNGATSREVFTSIEEQKIELTRIVDADQEIITRKNDPMLQGTNGVLTLGFLVSMAISLAGFVIYWILSLKSRVLQFGIIRAMGLEKSRVSRMLIWEHLLISGTAIVIGIVIGRVSANLFVPLIQLVYASSEQVPPFRIVIEGQDFLQIYVIGALMIATGIALFRLIISKLNVHQALKLGEE